MRRRKRSPNRSMLSRMRGTSAMSTPVPRIIEALSISNLQLAIWISPTPVPRLYDCGEPGVPPGWTGEAPVAPSHDASRCHRTQYLYQNRVLFRKQGAQINHDTALFDAGDYRRSAGAETGAEFVGAEIDMAKRDQPGGQYRRWG